MSGTPSSDEIGLKNTLSLSLLGGEALTFLQSLRKIYEELEKKYDKDKAKYPVLFDNITYLKIIYSLLLAGNSLSKFDIDKLEGLLHELLEYARPSGDLLDLFLEPITALSFLIRSPKNSSFSAESLNSSLSTPESEEDEENQDQEEEEEQKEESVEALSGSLSPLSSEFIDPIWDTIVEKFCEYSKFEKLEESSDLRRGIFKRILLTGKKGSSPTFAISFLKENFSPVRNTEHIESILTIKILVKKDFTTDPEINPSASMERNVSTLSIHCLKAARDYQKRTIQNLLESGIGLKKVSKDYPALYGSVIDLIVSGLEVMTANLACPEDFSSPEPEPLLPSDTSSLQFNPAASLFVLGHRRTHIIRQFCTDFELEIAEKSSSTFETKGVFQQVKIHVKKNTDVFFYLNFIKPPHSQLPVNACANINIKVTEDNFTTIPPITSDKDFAQTVLEGLRAQPTFYKDLIQIISGSMPSLAPPPESPKAPTKPRHLRENKSTTERSILPPESVTVRKTPQVTRILLNFNQIFSKFNQVKFIWYEFIKALCTQFGLYSLQYPEGRFLDKGVLDVLIIINRKTPAERFSISFVISGFNPPETIDPDFKIIIPESLLPEDFNGFIDHGILPLLNENPSRFHQIIDAIAQYKERQSRPRASITPLAPPETTPKTAPKQLPKPLPDAPPRRSQEEQRAITQKILAEIERSKRQPEPFAVIRTKRNPNCALDAIRESLIFQGENELAYEFTTAEHFANKVVREMTASPPRERKFWLELVPNSWRRRGELGSLKLLFIQHFIEDIKDWQTSFANSDYCFDQTEFKLISYIWNIAFKFYAFDPNASAKEKTINFVNEIHCRSTESPAVATVHLVRSLGKLGKLGREIFSFDALAIKPSVTQFDQIQARNSHRQPELEQEKRELDEAQQKLAAEKKLEQERDQEERKKKEEQWAVQQRKNDALQKLKKENPRLYELITKRCEEFCTNLEFSMTWDIEFPFFYIVHISKYYKTLFEITFSAYSQDISDAATRQKSLSFPSINIGDISLCPDDFERVSRYTRLDNFHSFAFSIYRGLCLQRESQSDENQWRLLHNLTRQILKVIIDDDHRKPLHSEASDLRLKVKIQDCIYQIPSITEKSLGLELLYFFDCPLPPLSHADSPTEQSYRKSRGIRFCDAGFHTYPQKWPSTQRIGKLIDCVAVIEGMKETIGEMKRLGLTQSPVTPKIEIAEPLKIPPDLPKEPAAAASAPSLGADDPLSDSRRITQVGADRCSVMWAYPDGNCGFTATYLSLTLQGQQALGEAFSTREKFIALVERLHQNQDNSALQSLISEIFQEADSPDLANWKKQFKGTGYYMADVHFKLISYVYGIEFKFYALSHDTGTLGSFIPEIGSERIYENTTRAPIATVHLTHVSTQTNAYPNHFDALVINPTEDQSHLIQEINWHHTNPSEQSRQLVQKTTATTPILQSLSSLAAASSPFSSHPMPSCLIFEKVFPDTRLFFYMSIRDQYSSASSPDVSGHKESFLDSSKVKARLLKICWGGSSFPSDVQISHKDLENPLPQENLTNPSFPHPISFDFINVLNLTEIKLPGDFFKPRSTSKVLTPALSEKGLRILMDSFSKTQGINWHLQMDADSFISQKLLEWLSTKFPKEPTDLPVAFLLDFNRTFTTLYATYESGYLSVFVFDPRGIDLPAYPYEDRKDHQLRRAKYSLEPMVNLLINLLEKSRGTRVSVMPINWIMEVQGEYSSWVLSSLLFFIAMKKKEFIELPDPGIARCYGDPRPFTVNLQEKGIRFFTLSSLAFLSGIQNRLAFAFMLDSLGERGDELLPVLAKLRSDWNDGAGHNTYYPLAYLEVLKWLASLTSGITSAFPDITGSFLHSRTRLVPGKTPLELTVESLNPTCTTPMLQSLSSLAAAGGLSPKTFHSWR